MKILTYVGENRIDVNVGAGGNSVLWLAILVAIKHAEMFFPHQFKLPVEVKRMDRTVLKHRQRIRDCLVDCDEVRITLSDWAFRNNSEPFQLESQPDWGKEAFGADGHLCELEIVWMTEAGGGRSIPSHVRGSVSFDPMTSELYRTTGQGADFDIPLQPVDLGDGRYRWVARLKTAPGTARFVFMTSDGLAMTSKHLATVDGMNEMRIEPDLPWPAEPLDMQTPDECSSQFSADWRKLRVPDCLVLHLPLLKRALNRAFAQFSVTYALLAVFARPVTVEELIYLIRLDDENNAVSMRRLHGDKEISRAGMMQICLDIFVSLHPGLHGSELVDAVAADLSSMLDDESRVFRNKALIDSEGFVGTVRRLRAMYYRDPLLCFDRFELDPPPVLTFMTFLESVVAKVGVDELLLHV